MNLLGATRTAGDTVVVDARWAQHTGVGRFTRVLLDGLHQIRPPGRWLVWGPRSLAGHPWAGARLVESSSDPTSLFAQRGLLSIPPGRIIALHAVRPLALWRRSAVVLHDVIPIIHAGSAAERVAWRSFLTLSVRSAERVLVYSEATADRATEMLGVPTSRLRRIVIGVEPELVARTRRLRREGGPSGDHLLYVGQVKPHKNLGRALRAFACSAHGRHGRFVAVVPTPAAAAEIKALAAAAGVVRLDVGVDVADDELAQLYATAAAVIQPSLEEGYGLAVAEALAAGTAVCCSDVPSLREAAQGQAVLFDPCDTDGMAAAIDLAVSSGTPGPVTLPSPKAMAERFLAALA